MFRNSYILPVLLSLSVSLSACGGGGGGGNARVRTGVRVLHAAPEVSPVDLIQGAGTGAAVLQTARFSDPSPYLPLSPGQTDFSVTISRRPGDLLGQFSVNVAKGEKRSLLVVGGTDSLPLEVREIVTTDLEPETNQAAISVIHGAIGAAAIRVLIDGQDSGVEVAYGQGSAPFLIPPGQHSFTVRRTADGATIGNYSLLIEAKSQYSLLVAGEVDYFISLRAILE